MMRWNDQKAKVSITWFAGDNQSQPSIVILRIDHQARSLRWSIDSEVVQPSQAVLFLKNAAGKQCQQVNFYPLRKV